MKQRWNAKTYKRYTVSLRKDEDAELIKLVESSKTRRGTTDIFREALEKLKNEG